MSVHPTLKPSWAADPMISAAYVDIIRRSERQFTAIGRLGTYDVRITDDGEITCTCIAGSFGRRCRHVIATLRQFGETMPLPAPQSRQSDERAAKRKLVPLVPTATYGAMLSRYTKPYSKSFQGKPPQEVVGIALLITHDQNNDPLRHRTEVFKELPFYISWNQAENKQSGLFSLYCALAHFTMTPEQIWAQFKATNELPDIDKYIGGPLRASIETKPGSNHRVYMNLRSIYPATPDLRKAISPIYKSASFETHDGRKFMTKPEPDYLTEAEVEAQQRKFGAVGAAGDRSDLDDELPF